jgi:hypothetical protein
MLLWLIGWHDGMTGWRMQRVDDRPFPQVDVFPVNYARRRRNWLFMGSSNEVISDQTMH